VQALRDVAREADVVAIGVSVAVKDVDETSRFHALSTGTNEASVGGRIH
jgi:hypothetical protein